MKLLLKTKNYTALISALDVCQTDIKPELSNTLKSQAEQKSKDLTNTMKNLEPSLLDMKNTIIKDFGSEEKFENDMSNRENTRSRFISVPKKTTDDCIKYAWLLYDSGRYEESKKLISRLICVADHYQDLLNLNWGRFFLNFIFKLQTEKKEGNEKQLRMEAIGLWEELKSLRHRMEIRPAETQFEVISGRCTLLHMVLAVVYLFNLDPDYDYLIELFSHDYYMSALQTCAPHLLRYLILMLILCKNKKKSAKFDFEHITAIYENK